MTFKELEKIMISHGWYHHHTNGSHYKTSKVKMRVEVEKVYESNLSSIIL